jgi:tRNA nucleotidyltransferase (CCA-adding enzyme)
MGKLQKEFGKFHDIIKLGTFEENSALREKRDLLVNELTKSLGDEVIPGTETKLTFTKFDQGSYAMNTGIIPMDNDYDIDVGIIFDVTNSEYDSKKLKKLVYTALNKVLKRTVTYNRPCITVEYSAGYHVDLAIYAKNDNDIHIAWGK